jgi:hypothetical protein
MPHLTHDTIGIQPSAPEGSATAPSVAREACHGRGLDARWTVAGADCSMTGGRKGQAARHGERPHSGASSDPQ